jgi:hypothetical protein
VEVVLAGVFVTAAPFAVVAAAAGVSPFFAVCVVVMVFFVLRVDRGWIMLPAE